MVIPQRLGRHRLALSGDVLSIEYDGPITLDDCTALRGIFAGLRADHGPCFLLADMRKCTGIEPEARKYMADWSKDRPDEALAGTAMFGMSFTMRAIVGLTLTAIKFLGKGTELEGVVFPGDEAEARRWIDERRELRYRESAHVGR